MAAFSLPSDLSVEERIYQLQKLHDPCLSQVLEEAEQLCGGGRHIEAAALVEKAEAMTTAAPASGISSVPEHHSEPAAAESFTSEPIWARLISETATGLAKVLVGAIQKMDRHVTEESRGLISALGERLDKLQSGVEAIQPLRDHIESLLQTGTAVQERYEQLAAVTASLQEADARHISEIGAVRMEVQQLSASATSRIEEVCRRVERQERDLSAANSTMAELASRVATAMQRLERHAVAIRATRQQHQERASAFNELAGALMRMETLPQGTDQSQQL